MRRELDDIKATTRKMAVVLAGNAERFSRIESRLDSIDNKLETLNAVKQALESFTSEIIASRNDRLLFNRTFDDQRETLLDHELRLTRLERRGRSS
ncbi:MAG: hypothetical protein SF051_15195 [Elusimicrobiota bacterium]|nr:hypothetical protein [Elusimicrobiota bacterium]